MPAFAPGGSLRDYVVGRQASRFAGIAEAFAVQVPERFGVELMELIDDDFALHDLIPGFRASLLWRRQSAFTARTLQTIERFADYMDDDPWLETIIAISTEPENIFNANYLDSWLRPLSLPERDELWSARSTYLAEIDGNAIDTLIQWVLANGLNPIDPERAQLAATTLVWLTSLSHRAVRDTATKALAILLVQRRPLAAQLIERFADTNDAYVVDRVLAAAYGAATRSYSNDGLATLAEATYAAVYAREAIQVHALIRDHARGIIELAAHRGVLPASISLDRVRPPYVPSAPLEIIEDAVLDSFVQDYGGTSLRDEIVSSTVEDGDFARYEIDPLAQKFLQLPLGKISLSIESRYDKWYAQVVEAHPERITALQRVIDLSGQLSAMPYDFNRWLDDVDVISDAENAADEKPGRKEIEEERDAASGAFQALLSETERRDYAIYAEGWVEHVMWDADTSPRHPSFDNQMARRWIAWRAHNLGWTPQRFSDLERGMQSHGRMEHRVERIGKKYQWIAYHELTGRLSELVAVDGGFNYEPQPYSGPWQVGTREMDPTILVTRTEQRESSQPATWWSPQRRAGGRIHPSPHSLDERRAT